MKKFLFAFLLLICTSNVSLVASDLSDAKSSFKSAQKELSAISYKRDKAQKKQNELQAEYDEALAKIAANQDKPKSLAYKNAVKKSEALPARIEENAKLLAAQNRQVDSLQSVVSGCESALSQIQEAEAAEEVAEGKSEEEEPVVAEITDPVLLPVEKEDRSDIIELKEDVNIEATTGGEASSSKSTTCWGKVWRVIKIIFWIFVGIIVLVIFLKIGGRGGSSGSSSSRSSSSSASTSSRSDEKKRRIADKRAEIARQQEKIARLQDSIISRKRNRLPYSDLEQSIANCRQRIQSLKVDIANIRVGR